MDIGPHPYDIEPQETKKKISEHQIHNALHKVQQHIEQVKTELNQKINRVKLYLMVSILIVIVWTTTLFYYYANNMA